MKCPQETLGKFKQTGILFTFRFRQLIRVDFMKFTASAANPLNLKSDCIILLSEGNLDYELKDFDEALRVQFIELLKATNFNGKKGVTRHIYTPTMVFKQALFVGIDGVTDKQGEINVIELAADQCVRVGVNTILWLDCRKDSEPSWMASIVAEKMFRASYKFKQRTINETKAPSEVIYLVKNRGIVALVQSELNFGAAVGAGLNVAKKLGDLPANICTPSYLAEFAQNMAEGVSPLKSIILNGNDMELLKMKALLSVTAGSREAPKFIELHYEGGTQNEPPVVLIGKAVTFDSGGISLKPSSGMDEMKFDMCGGASVMGVLHALILSRLKLNVIGLIPAVENMPSGGATKPGDVITSMSGQTIEVLNTDAEGRLILCDSLTYCVKFKPVAVIDIATLTGACVMALGKHVSGLLSNDEELANELLTSGTEAGDRAWRLPLWSDYDKQLKSNFADMANIGGREAGTITAACFLARFAKNIRWAHLDIAGTAWLSGSKKGATGRPVPLLMNYLRRLTL